MSLPDIIAERCVHDIIDIAGCSACVDACPRDAWVLDDNLLGILPDACDGCGLCAAACPQGAIQIALDPLLLQDTHGRVAALACERVQGVSGPAGRVPCLHAVGTGDILALCRSGVDEFLLAAGECARCPRGRGEGLLQRLERVHGMLADRGLSGPTVRVVSGEVWDQRVKALAAVRPADRGPAMARRLFLRRGVGAGIEACEGLLRGGTAEGNPYTPPGRVYPPQRADSIMPLAPAIQADRCAGCNACTTLCPHGALTLEVAEDGPGAYRIVPENCSGCGICTDVCDYEAVEVRCWSRPGDAVLALTPRHCTACGVEFAVPRDHPAKDGLCHICRRTNHHARLHQVMG